MPEIAHTGTPLLYLGFTALVVVLVAVDFVLLRTQGTHKVTVKEAAAWSAVWVLAVSIVASLVTRRQTLPHAT